MGVLYEFPSGRRLNPEPSHDEITPQDRTFLQWLYERHTDIAERHWRLAEDCARKLGYLAVERGLPSILEPGEGQLPIVNLIEGEEQ